MNLFRFGSSVALCTTLIALALPASTAMAQTNAAAGHSNWQQSNNKERMLQLSKSLFGEGDVNTLGQYFAPMLIQHDPKLADGRQAMLDSIQAMRLATPGASLTVKHALAQDDMVFVQSHISVTPANELSGLNRYDIYRLDHGQVVEHWALQSKAPTRPVSGNSAFSDLYAYTTPQAPASAQQARFNGLFTRMLSEQVFGQRNFGLVNRQWASGYIQHNPGVANGRAALLDVIEYIAPIGSSYRVYQSIAEGDLALVCSQNQEVATVPNNEFTGSAICDIYRVANFELVEHWDIGNRVPQASVNGHSMFSHLYRGQH